MPNVNVTYEEMHSAARRLNAGREEITAKLAELKTLVNSLVNGGYVTDGSSKQFEAAYTDFTAGATRAVEGLQSMSTYLSAAADTFQRADQELSNSLPKS